MSRRSHQGMDVTFTWTRVRMGGWRQRGCVGEPVTRLLCVTVCVGDGNCCYKVREEKLDPKGTSEDN